MPTERPALLSRRDRLNLGTVKGPGAVGQVAPLGKTLIGGVHPSSTGSVEAGRSPRRGPASAATKSGAPYAKREPRFEAPSRRSGKETLLGGPSPNQPLMRAGAVEGAHDWSGSEEVALSVRGALPTRAPKKGLSEQQRRRLKSQLIGLLGLILAAAVFGGLLAITLPQPQLKVVDFHVTRSGHDRLSLRCSGCPASAGLRQAGRTAVLQSGTAVFEFEKPLPVGLNHLDFELIEAGRAPRRLSLALSVAFRVAVEDGPGATWPPEAEIVVHGQAGARVSIASATCPIQHGVARHRVSLREQTKGPLAAASVIDEAIPVVVGSLPDQRETMAHVRASVVPLTFSRRSTTDGSGPTRPWLKGTTLPGARVLLRRADDESALLAETVADGRGRFAFQRRVGAQGKLLLMATLPGHALRWAFVKG